MLQQQNLWGVRKIKGENTSDPSEPAQVATMCGATDTVDCDDCNNCDEAGTQDNHTKLYGCYPPHSGEIRAISKSLLSCMGIFGSNAMHNCLLATSGKCNGRWEGEDVLGVLDPRLLHMQHIWMQQEEKLAMHHWNEQNGWHDGQWIQ